MRSLPVESGNASTGNGFSHSTHDDPAFQPLYDGSRIDRNEFVRLTLQALKDAGFHNTASQLSNEAGIEAESGHIAQFKQAVLEGQWQDAQQLLKSIDADYHLHEKEYQFLIAQQHYLELLESRQSRKALHVLRNELAPASSVSTAKLHSLSSLMMCSEPADLRSRASWSGAAGGSRTKLLQDLQTHLSSHVMLPGHRLEALLDQARAYQCSICPYHVSSLAPTQFSLLSDHTCPQQVFPNHCSHVLRGHHGQVWTLAFSHDGRYLATAGSDKTIIIWSVEDDFEALHNLTDHKHGVWSLAWSPDDSILLSSADSVIMMWDPRTGRRMHTLKEHLYTVSALAWLPDGKTFVSAGMDAKLYFWDLNGNVKYTWRTGPYRIVDAAISPDGTKLVAVGKAEVPIGNSDSPSDNGSNRPLLTRSERRLHVFDVTAQRQIASITQPRELTCVTITDDSRYVLVNEVPDEVRLYNLEDASLVRRFKGHKQGDNILRNCFGGRSQNFVITGSDDSKIYAWHRETGAQVEVLSGHLFESVNDVAWNRSHSAMMASGGDDATVRIWEAHPSSSSLLRLSNGQVNDNGSS